MMKHLLQLTAICGALFLVSCKDDQTSPEPQEPNNQLRVTVQPTYGAVDLYLDSTYSTPEGYDVQFTDIKF